MEWILYIWMPLFYTPHNVTTHYAWKAEGIYYWDSACKKAAANLNLKDGYYRCISNRNGEIAK